MEGCQAGANRRVSLKSDVTCSTRAQSKESGDEEMLPGLFVQRERRLTQHGFADLDARTTVMLRNLPECFTRARMLYLLGKEGFSGRFNFLYVPVCFREKNSLCYAFINFVDLTSLELFRDRFHGFRQWGIPGIEHVGEVCSCERHQGLSSIIQYYRNNSVMHPSVPDECKPILLSGTQRIPFPSPLKKIKMPKKLKGSDAHLDDERLMNKGALVVMLIL
ncbi:unnamed protein product [Cladocopium goreaui]|uniref:Mei2-like C-terminal RNA recognition motif domain-containing protein n=1 Tax=Cladocopium goreaui TaxID=2562237 RepID=A0A9P1FV59_9DINO|nr:unnamed protein product [Cladocopium goreaui]